MTTNLGGKVTTLKRESGWLKFAFLEALVRSASRNLQKAFALTQTTLSGALFLSVPPYIISTTGSIIIGKLQKNSFYLPKILLLWAILHGIVAAWCNLSAQFSFMTGGDISMTTLIVALSIIPATVMDRFILKTKFIPAQILGIALGVIASVVAIKPSFEWSSLTTPWFWWAWGTSLGVALNQVFMRLSGEAQDRYKKDVPPMVFSTYSSLATVIVSFLFIQLIGGFSAINLPQKAWLILVAIGLLVILLYLFNILIYKVGKKVSIAAKKIVEKTSYLMIASVLGVIFFNEVITWNRIVAFLFYLPAFYLVVLTKKS